MTENKTHCVIFDCDGTLVDSERLCCEAIRDTFNQYGAEMTIADAMEHFEGGKLADILSTTRERLNMAVSVDELEPVYREHLDRLFAEHLKPMTGAIELLEVLKRRGIEFCVASNGPKTKIENALELTGLRSYFGDRIFSAFDTNSWKPDPDLVLYTAMAMGFRLEECIYVDDTPKGLEAGIKAGVKTVQLLGFSSKQPPEEVVQIKNLQELESLL
ncbi:HAD-IA family hydrolase [Vibrio sp. TRT 21S02]|uniref:HAD-IA family hydrolase n=1 Tax=unclassified Vibrio TaxID=2614977 RepID=UPI00349FAF2C